jgi:uroporphyrinogen decarboxylase
MSSRERLESLYRGERPDRVGLHALSNAFNTVNAGYKVSDAYQDPEKAFEAMLWTFQMYGWELYLQYCVHSITAVSDFGGEVRMPEGPYEGALVVKSHPMDSAQDLDKLTLPDPRKAGRIPEALAYARLQADKDLPATFFSRSPFTFAANLSGLDSFAKWLYRDQSLCHRMMELSLDHIINVIKVWVEEFGPDRTFVWMSSPSESNQLVSPKIFQKFALPYHLRYHEKLQELGVKRFGFHVCGDQNLNLPALAEAQPWPHPAVLSFGHEVDLERAAELFPHDIIYGNIEPTLIHTGSLPDIYEKAGQTIAKGKKAPGGFILSTGCGLPATSPPAKVYALTKAVQDFGSYQ